MDHYSSAVLPDRPSQAPVRASKRCFPAGASLMREGDAGDSVYLILVGRVRVEQHPPLGDPVLQAELGPGDIVGEMGALLGDPRLASAIAVEDTEALELRARSNPAWKPCPSSPEQAVPLLSIIRQRRSSVPRRPSTAH